MPEQDAVLAITGGIDVFDMQQPLNMVWDMLLPAMHADPLSADDETQDALSKRLLNLRLIPVQGRSTSPIASQVSGRSYAVDANELEIETIVLNFAETGCTVRIKTAANGESIACGYDVWQRGQPTSLFNQAMLFDRTPVAASGAWTADDTFTIDVRLYETPFSHRLVCHFVGDEMLIETQVNVSLESLKPQLLLAYPV